MKRTNCPFCDDTLTASDVKLIHNTFDCKNCKCGNGYYNNSYPSVYSLAYPKVKNNNRYINTAFGYWNHTEIIKHDQYTVWYYNFELGSSLNIDDETGTVRVPSIQIDVSYFSSAEIIEQFKQNYEIIL